MRSRKKLRLPDAVDSTSHALFPEYNVPEPLPLAQTDVALLVRERMIRNRVQRVWFGSRTEGRVAHCVPRWDEHDVPPHRSFMLPISYFPDELRGAAGAKEEVAAETVEEEDVLEEEEGDEMGGDDYTSTYYYEGEEMDDGAFGDDVDVF